MSDSLSQTFLAITRNSTDLEWLQGALAPLGQVINVGGGSLDELPCDKDRFIGGQFSLFATDTQDRQSLRPVSIVKGGQAVDAVQIQVPIRAERCLRDDMQSDAVLQ